MLAVIIAPLYCSGDSRGSSESDGVAALTTVTVASPQETAIPSATPAALHLGHCRLPPRRYRRRRVPATLTATSSALVLPEPLPGWQWRERDEPFCMPLCCPTSWESVTESLTTILPFNRNDDPYLCRDSPALARRRGSLGELVLRQSATGTAHVRFVTN